jgi:hypothetical protein
MSTLKIERIGGLPGFGGKNSHLRSIGEIDTDKLSKEDQQIVEDLFRNKARAADTLARDNFRYRITRTTSKGTESVEADEDKVPNAVKQCVKDQIV